MFRIQSWEWLAATVVWIGLLTQPVFSQSGLPAVFVTNNVGDSVTSFTLNPDGSLNYVGMIAAGDSPQTISLTPDGQFLAVANGTMSMTVEELRIFYVNSDATLTLRLLTTTPDSPLDCQWVSNSILAVTETSLSGDNHVIMYEWDPTANTLVQVDIAFTGSFNTSLAVSFDRSLLFANNSLGTDSIYSFSFDAAGMLTQNDNQVTNPIYPLGIAASPDGNFVYSAGGISGTGHEILSFAVDANGALSPIAGAQSPGQSPKVIDMTDDGTILVAGHGTDSTVRSFLRDPLTGLIVPTGFSFDVGAQGNLGDLQVVGDMMFVTDESTSDDGVRGLYSFRINADGSFSQLGPIVDTQGSRPEYIAAWPGLGPVFVTPQTFTVTRGNLAGGGIAELSESDDFDLVIQRASADIQALTELEIKAISSTETPSQFAFTLEAAVFARSMVTQTIYLFDYNADGFEQVDSRAAQQFSDQVVTVMPSGDLSRFVQPGTGCIEARIQFQSTAPRQQFSSNIDQAVWMIE
jgi:6-phosphogluconolactonase (cycloisomerase 2 family)